MKKIYSIILSVLIISSGTLRADEGMWLLPLIQKLNIKTMNQMGFNLTADDIYNINSSSLKDAIVHFGGGCTAEIISAEGLLITNHHCGYGNIRALSSVENDYLKDGYWAMSRNQELPSRGLSVTFLESFTDVTDQIEKAVKKAKDKEQYDKLYKEATDKIVKKAVGDNKFLVGRVTTMYGGNQFYLVVSKTYRDVRFVGAPPSSIGKFGADTDNWTWPRHTGDFSMFRVYADKDNNPAEYSPDNVPYRPKQHLKVSLKGIEQDDFAMIIGYPGRTNRFMTVSELIETRDITNAISIYVRGIRQEVMMEDMVADPKIKIQYASKYSGSSNGWKKWIGMNETFAKLDVENRRAQEEKKFTEWVNKDPKRVAKYGNALNKVNNAISERADAYVLYRYLTESLANVELGSLAMRLSNSISKVLDPNTKEKDLATEMNRINQQVTRFYPDYSASTDRKVAKAMLKVYRENIPADKQPDFYKNVVDARFSGNIDAYVDYVFDNSLYTDPAKLQKALDSKSQALLTDPAVEYARSYSALLPALQTAINKNADSFAEGKKEYIAGTLEMNEGKAIYPDANSTMRMTYGKVLPYSPKDAVQYDIVTTLKGVMEKEDPTNWEFEVPDKLKELYKNKDYGQYADKNGDMVVCFISNNDITGGNSGSPVLNADGELIGLAFDGNWEAMSGDIIFEPELQRCINVDIRYCLFIVDKYGGAGYLLNEMTIVK